MQVKTIIPHDNAVDLKPVGTHEYHKPKGSVYEHPDPQHLIDQKIVELHASEKSAGK